jgi:hypothetical protein
MISCHHALRWIAQNEVGAYRMFMHDIHTHTSKDVDIYVID